MVMRTYNHEEVFFLLLAFMATSVVNAEPVSRQQALQKAQQFITILVLSSRQGRR